ncbi:uncharacterized protein LOC114760552 [Neltuma alba]|uniref:uncharacterized protein LOC114760552 n=1 Tax=Neltuma alba TaxID=207710 RepID=UPI0010A55915|nr:uncharacterized protein LOC114760552 [Prosopis alba]
MEDYGERAELRRMQREQERERRRIRDRERRQSMTQEQRERHLARRRRNYQLRRQRAANNNNRICFPLDETDAAATTSHDGHGQASFIVPCSISDYRVLQTESSEQQSSHYIDGSSSGVVHMEALTYKPTNLPTRLRLSHIRQLARNMIHSIADHHDSQIGIHQIVPHLIPNGDLSSQGSIRKSLRLNRVKQLARSLNSPSKEISAQSQNDKVQQANNVTFPGTTYGDGFNCF